jgi:hypothetical protein
VDPQIEKAVAFEQRKKVVDSLIESKPEVIKTNAIAQNHHRE